MDTRRFILQKARRHTLSDAPTACRHTVSGSLSLRSRGAFHLSLTVLLHYRSPSVFSLRRWSSQIQTGFLVSRPTWGHHKRAAQRVGYGALTLYDRPSHAVLLPCPALARVPASPRSDAPLPSVRNACRLTRTQFGLFPLRSPLLRESRLFSLPRGTEMFQFPRCPPYPYGFSIRSLPITEEGFPHSETLGS